MSVTDVDREAAKEMWRLSLNYGSPEKMHDLCAAHRTRAHAEGYEAAVRDVVAWLRQRRAMPITSKYIALQIEAGAFKP